MNGNWNAQQPRWSCIIAAVVALVGAPLAVLAQILDTVQVSVDGHRMQLLVAGRGTPTIVLESGSGGTSRTWRTLQPTLSSLSRTVSYDRAGLGQSEPSNKPRSARVIAEDLHRALRAAKLPPPYIFVAHSADGIYARVFAAMYASEVAGLVLVDPTAEDFYARAQREFPRVFQRFDSIDAASIASGPPGELAEESMWETSLTQARALDAGFAGPAIVLSSSRLDLAELGALWTDEHRLWASGSERLNGLYYRYENCDFPPRRCVPCSRAPSETGAEVPQPTVRRCDLGVSEPPFARRSH